MRRQLSSAPPPSPQRPQRPLCQFLQIKSFLMMLPPGCEAEAEAEAEEEAEEEEEEEEDSRFAANLLIFWCH